MLWSDTSPDGNTSEIRCLKPNTIALLRKAIEGMWIPIAHQPYLGLVSSILSYVGFDTDMPGCLCLSVKCNLIQGSMVLSVELIMSSY